MNGEEIKVLSVDESSSLLGRAYWLEAQFELSSQWMAYITVKDQEYRDAIFKITHDSEKHKKILKKIFSDIKGLDPEKAVEDSGLKHREFDFDGKRDEEIITELMKYENLALDIYTKLSTYVDRELMQKIWKGHDPKIFYEQIELLISDEKKHVELLRPIAGRIKRY